MIEVVVVLLRQAECSKLKRRGYAIEVGGRLDGIECFFHWESSRFYVPFLILHVVPARTPIAAGVWVAQYLPRAPIPIRKARRVRGILMLMSEIQNSMLIGVLSV